MPRRKTLLDLPPSYQEQAAKQLYGERPDNAQIISAVRSSLAKIKPENGCDYAQIFTLPYPPSVNTYWRSIVIRGQVRVLISKKGRDYKKAVADILKGHAAPPSAPLAINLKFYRPRRIGDLDNCLKATLDALKGILFVDDSQICEIHATREDDKENPRVEVSVRPL